MPPKKTGGGARGGSPAPKSIGKGGGRAQRIQAAENAARQFRAVSANQTQQFMTSLSTQVDQFNTQQANTMEQFNAQQINARQALEFQVEADLEKANAAMVNNINQFNAQVEFDRSKFNVANAQAIEQSNLAWRRQANTINTAAANAWGGTAANTAATQSVATSSNNVVSFALTANTGYKLSLTQIPAYNIRRSGTGFSIGIWQYSINGGSFNDIGSSIIWGSITTSSGNAQSAITLSGISALQNVAAGNTITLRVVLWGASGTGSWYFNQPVAGTNNLIVTGTVALESVAPTPTCVANITASGATSFCQGGNVTLTANSGSSYLWSNGATTQSISATTSGTYSVIVTNANGCSASTSIIVTEPTPLVATITSNAPNTTICNGGTAVLSASISGGLGNINYQWQYQDNSGNWVNVSGTGWSGTNVATPFTSSGRNASPSTTRAYRIVVTSVANNQCSVIATQLVTVIADPVFTITSTQR